VIGSLTNMVAKSGLPVNFIVMSDHGMVEVDNKHPLPMPQEINRQKVIIPHGEAMLQLYTDDKVLARQTYQVLRKNAHGFKVYLKNELPRRWHYNDNDDRYQRIGDIILIPEPSRIFNLTNTPVDPGKHGFDPMRPEMLAGFFAWGPAFRQGMAIKEFEIVHVYPLVAKILGLAYTHQTDGKLSVLAPTLK
jgi:predicted AlkP superfamily pyrophosphatase or phosphodiesterase